MLCKSIPFAISRRSRFRARLASFACLLALAAAGAARAEGDFRLGPPTIVKAARQSRFLSSGDLNGDGRADLITVDNNKSVLELFLQQEDADRRFERRERILERVAYSLGVADLNSDGRDDVLIGADPPVILFQDKEGRLGRSEELRTEGMFAAAGDLNADGRDDVVVFGKDRFALIFQTADGALERPREFPNAIDTDQPPEPADLNGDGRIDLMYANAQKKNEVVVRYQQGPGEFGPEQSLDLGFYKQLVVLGRGQNEAPALVTVEQRTNAVKLMSRNEPVENGGKFSAGPIQLLALPADSKPAGLSVLVRDLDGDGLDDLALFSRELAEATFYGWDRKGRFSRQTRPVLTDVVSVAAPEDDKDGPRPPLFLLSKKERAIGAMRPEKEGRYSVPQPLDLKSAPLAVACGDLDGSGRNELVYCVKNTTGVVEVRRWLKDESAAPLSWLDRHIDVAGPKTGQAAGEDPGLVVSLGAESKNADPEAMTLTDLDGDGRLDLIVYFEYKSPEVLTQSRPGAFQPLLTGEGVLKGLFNEVRPDRLAVTDIDGDGRPEVLIAREGFVRALRIDSSGAFTVVDQFNGKSANAQINAVAAADLDGDGRPEILLLDRTNNVVTVYARDAKGAFGLAANVDIRGLQPYRLLVGRLDADAKDDLVIVSDRGLAVLHGGGRPETLAARWRRQAEGEDEYYALVESGDLDGDGADELLALENHEHVLEFYRVGDKDDPERFYHFKVFDDLRASRYRGRSRELPPEPREAWIGDLNGDDRGDLALLANDRLLVYFQKP